MSNDSSFSGRKAFKRPLAPAPVKPKVPKDYQNDISYQSWNLNNRPGASAEVRLKDLSYDNSFASRSSGSRPLAPATAKPKAFKELHLTPVSMKGPPSVTKRRSAPPNVQQPRKQQVISEERYFQEADKSRLVQKKVPKPSSRKVASKPDSGDSDGRPRSSGSDEEREAVQYARRSLEQALEKADSLVDQLEKLEDDIEALEEEKVALLDELLVCEGLAVNPDDLTPMQMVERTRARRNSDIWHWFVGHQGKSLKRWSVNIPVTLLNPNVQSFEIQEPKHQLCLSNSRSMKEDIEQPVIPDKIGRLLHFASQGDVEAVTRILDDGLSVNSADYDGRTAMHLAASEGHVGVIEVLLKRKANINPIDRWGETPLANARRYNYTKVCEILVANGGTAPALTPEYEIDPAELALDRGIHIGKGAYGEVRLVNWRGTRVAAKTILQGLATNQQIEKEFIDELALLQKLRHPNIVQFLGAVTKSTPLVIVTEYLPRGDLEDILRRKGRIPAREAVQFALDIARGMNYLHQHKPDPIVHRDLKPRNLLQDEAGHLKVADFGLSKLLEEATTGRFGGIYAMTGETGSYRYMAPEVFRHEPYDKSVDIFSFAIIVQEMFEGGPCFKTRFAHEIALARAQDDARPMFSAKHYPPKMKDLLRQCWDGNPQARPNFAQIITRLEDIQMNLKRRFWTPRPIYSAVTNFQASWYRCIQYNKSTLSLTIKHRDVPEATGSQRGRPGYLGTNCAVLRVHDREIQEV